MIWGSNLSSFGDIEALDVQLLGDFMVYASKRITEVQTRTLAATVNIFVGCDCDKNSTKTKNKDCNSFQ